MSAQKFAFAIAAGATARLPAGRYFMITLAASALDVTTEGNPGSPVRFIGIGAGTKFGPVAEGQGWRNLLITSAGAQNLEVVISDDGLFDLANTVTIAGVPTVVVAPASAFATTVAETTLLTATSVDIAANLSRKVLNIQASSGNTGSLWIRDQAATANGGIELQPGQMYPYANTAALRIRNNSGATQSYSLQEET